VTLFDSVFYYFVYVFSLQACSVPVYLLIVLFAISSWISANGLFVEVPLFVDSLPEGWNLPSLLGIVTQAANVGVLVWSLLRWLCRPNETAVIYIMLLAATCATALVGIFWSVTVAVNGTQHSIPLLTLTAIIALVDCLSGVVFLPFIARFRTANYVTAYYIGGYMGGIIPAVVGLIQGVGKEPICSNSTHNLTNTSERPTPIFSSPIFSVGVFCSILCALIVVSLTSFTVLICAKRCRQEMSASSLSETLVIQSDTTEYQTRPASRTYVQNDSSEAEYQTRPSANRTYGQSDSFVLIGEVENVSSPTPPESSHFLKLLVILFTLSFLLFGVLPALQSFTCLPYGRVVYTLTVRLSTISGAVACICALYLSTRSLFKITLMMVFGVILCGYQIGLACLSPNPILHEYIIGKILVVSFVSVDIYR